MKTQTTVRIDDNIYREAKDILKTLGLSYSQAINLFNNTIVLNKGIPFDLKIPTTKTLLAMQQAKDLDGDFVELSDL